MLTCSPTNIVAVILFVIAGIIFLFGAIRSYRNEENFKRIIEVFSPYLFIVILLVVLGVSLLRGGT